jgi:hypothetical protein
MESKKEEERRIGEGRKNRSTRKKGGRGKRDGERREAWGGEQYKSSKIRHKKTKKAEKREEEEN